MVEVDLSRTRRYRHSAPDPANAGPISHQSALKRADGLRRARRRRPENRSRNQPVLAAWVVAQSGRGRLAVEAFSSQLAAMARRAPARVLPARTRQPGSSPTQHFAPGGSAAVLERQTTSVAW